MGLRMSVAWGCAGAQHGGAHGRSMGPCTGAQWCCARAHNGAARERCVGLRMGCAKGRAWGGGGGRLTTGFWRLPRRGPHQEDIGAWAASAMRRPHHRLLASRCRVGGGRLARGCAGAQHGAAHERCVGLRMSAAWGCAGAQHGAAHERCLGLRMSAAWGCV